MTISMPDSVNVNDLPLTIDGLPVKACLGYTDGRFPTAAALERMFPQASLVLLTVQGSTDPGAHGARVAHGTDIEPGDLTAMQAVHWVIGRLAAVDAGTGPDLGAPVLYASIEGQPGYGMGDVLQAMSILGIDRRWVRLLSAHYGKGPHICGPGSCGMSAVDMDGTQWTDEFVTPAGKVIDMSMLRDGFFGPTPAQAETERLVQQLGTVRQGDTGEAVKTVQGLCLARGYGIGPAGIDGNFGRSTLNTVRVLQASAGVAVDGVVGPETWPVLLDVA